MKLLLHICCGPCAVYPTEDLLNKNIDFTGVFFNPNIHPFDEFITRMENVEKLSAIKGFDVMYYENLEQQVWEKYEGEIEDRCYMCYTRRFEMVAQEAADNGYNAFSTTLLVSPYQRHEMIVEICNKMAYKYGVKFYYEDWRSGFREGQAKAKEYGLYRQKYCGCIKSKSYE